MGFEKINDLREKYNHRDLMNELDYGRRANHRGYTNAVQAEFWNWLCDAAYQRIQVLEQEPKTGHWIDNMDLGYHVSICSNCNWRGHGDVNSIYKSKYCPNCGAKMEGR